MNKTHPSAMRGFSLLETLVAIAILMIAIVVPFYGLQKAIQASFVSRDQLIASQLAQEGMEYIYYVRDNNYLYYNESGSYPGSGGWLANLSSCTTTTNQYGCIVDPAQNTVAGCSSSGCPVVYLNPTTKLYTQTASGNTATRFVRTIKITPVSGNPNEVNVTVTVTFTTLRQSYTVTATENLHNWL